MQSPLQPSNGVTRVGGFPSSVYHPSADKSAAHLVVCLQTSGSTVCTCEMPVLPFSQDALDMALRLALSIPLADIMAFRKVRLQYGA